MPNGRPSNAPERCYFDVYFIAYLRRNNTLPTLFQIFGVAIVAQCLSHLLFVLPLVKASSTMMPTDAPMQSFKRRDAIIRRQRQRSMQCTLHRASASFMYFTSQPPGTSYGLLPLPCASKQSHLASTPAEPRARPAAAGLLAAFDISLPHFPRTY